MSSPTVRLGIHTADRETERISGPGSNLIKDSECMREPVR